ncbi:SDHAF2 [Symbiodinium necroappetens]|uniref:SDHAF2 protein n=1 Tax=Symbiodinium necroappetens TaxID=1628268 RepID=A0A812X1B3_9DINO|nr:SDHAF2 [Symbiodinium necroappetens]
MTSPILSSFNSFDRELYRTKVRRQNSPCGILCWWTSPSGGEARAALTLRAANWLARQTGLWTYLGPWERVALLTAAAGLHCAPIGAVKAMGFKRDVFGALAGGDPLLSHVASSASTMLALSTAGLASIGTASGRPSSRGSTADDPNALWKLVRRLQYRARPPCALEDLKRVRMLLEADESPMPFKLEMLEGFSQEELEEALAAARERRLLLSGLVLAAADLAFLALPQKQHFAWADLARDDREVGIHAPQWLRGLAEVLAIPLYDTLHTLGELAYGASNGGHLLAVPLDHLRDHARHWKKHPLLTGATRRRSLRSSRGSSGTLETKEGSTVSRRSFRQDQVQLTIAAHPPSLDSREEPFAMLPGQVDEGQPEAGRQSPETAGSVTGQASEEFGSSWCAALTPGHVFSQKRGRLLGKSGALGPLLKMAAAAFRRSIALGHTGLGPSMRRLAPEGCSITTAPASVLRWQAKCWRVQAFPIAGCRSFSAVASDDMELLKRRKRLTWRAKSRGWLELDVLMGTFVEKHIADFDSEKLDLLEEVLELENPDLFKWFTKQVPVPEELLKENEVMKLMMEYVKSDHTSDFSVKGA